MSPGLITSLSALIVTALTTYLNGIGWFAAHPDVIHFLTQAVEPALLALLAGGTAFMSGSAWWTNFNRILTSVIALVEAERGGAGNPEARADAINRIIGLIPESALGWRGAILRIPGLRSWIIGFLLDRIVSATKKALNSNPGDKTELRNAVRSAVEKTKGSVRFGLLIGCALVSIAFLGAVYGAHTEANVKRRDVPLRFEPEFPAAAALQVESFDFVLLGTETSFNLPVHGSMLDKIYRGNLGSRYLLEPGPNRFEFRAISNKGIKGGPSTLTLNYIEPTPTPVPDPVPPPFKAIVDDDGALE